MNSNFSPEIYFTRYVVSRPNADISTDKFFVNVSRHHLPFTQLFRYLSIVNVRIELHYLLPLDV